MRRFRDILNDPDIILAALTIIVVATLFFSVA